VLDLQAGTDGGDPLAKAPVNGARIEAVEDAFEGIVGRDAVGKAEYRLEPVEAVTSEGDDLLLILGMGDDGTKGDGDDI